MTNRKFFLVSAILIIGIVSVITYWNLKKSGSVNISSPTTSGVFSFGVQADSHPERAGKMFNSDLYTLTLQNIVKANPNFYFMLGDDFSIDSLIGSGKISENAVDQIYMRQKQYLSGLTMPIYLVNGNHEQEAKYLLDGTNTSPAILARNAREKYFSSPGAETGYYSFEYGNALFVVIDFYWHSDIAVDNTAGADNTGGKGKRDLWQVTLGNEQYQWFKQTLQNSKVKYKFVFTHHVLGTGRGGIEEAKLYEWGGYSPNGSYDFQSKRPGWDLPIHELMVKNHVTIFFQGHDHLFAKQELDGLIYQEVPTPADNTYTAFNQDAYKSGEILPNAGFLKITVAAQQVKVDYIRSFLPSDETSQNKNNTISYSYTIQ